MSPRFDPEPVSAEGCPYCGTVHPATSRFCSECGRPVSSRAPPRVIGRHTGFRFQIDPLSPPPERYARWSVLVAGVAMAIMGSVLLVADAIVGGASSIGAACGPSAMGCPNAVFVWILLAPGLGLLLLGGALVVYAIVRTV